MQAPKDKASIPVLKIVGYILLTIVVTLLVYLISPTWVVPVVLILLTFPITWFVPPKWRRLARCGHVALSLSLLLAMAFFLALDAAVQAGLIGGNDLLNALLGDTAARVLLSLAGGGVVAAIFLAASFALATDMSTEWILSMREVYGVTRQQARRLLISTFLRTTYGRYVVEDGEIAQREPKGVLPALGGPGRVVIRPYNAVVFEQENKTTRIEGPGIVLTEKSEELKEVIDLRMQSMGFIAENVLTKDNVPLTLHCGVGFRIESRADTTKRGETDVETFEGSRFSGVISGDYPVYRRTIYRAVYGTTAAGWRMTSKGAAESKLREVLREYLLEDLYQLEERSLAQKSSAVDQIMKETLRRVSAVSHHWGTTITGFSIRTIDVPADVREKLIGMWAARYAKGSKLIEAEAERDSAITQAEGAREAMIARGKGQAEALAQVERVKAHAVEMLINQLLRGIREAEQTQFDPETVQRFARVIEQLSSNLVQDDLTALRYVEALEKLALCDAPKAIALGNISLEPRIPALPTRGQDQSR